MIEETIIITLEDFEKHISENTGSVVYFSTPACSVCKVLKPKVKEFIENEYPELQFAYVDTTAAKVLAGQKNIFTVPTILFYFEGLEFMRKSRTISIDELSKELHRPYSLLFD